MSARRPPGSEGEIGDREIRRIEHSLLGFGNYHDWAYGGIMTNKPNYVTYISQESFDSSDAQHRFHEWATLKKFESEKETMGEWKVGIRKSRLGWYRTSSF